ncbi:putative lipid II flippase FtsW [Ornithinimicrobium sediminis]|uniref:putative lipid II flippase FtsW n=1 Tax=Ornithinimicrobium sediminis TaxID=2904603 RepID=UPI001E5357BD|nr:putative lipid II flippase FtsW [Ornithinimicrobium sediminis]MCE0488196.1 putative lipid II flippase FtsW [Ornithinimicrobium sediminis]
MTTQLTRQGSSRPADPPPRTGLAAAGEWLRSPVAPYYLVLASAAALVSIGLVMVLSASSVRSYVETGSSYDVFVTQLAYAGVGILLAWGLSRLPVVWWKRLALPGLLVAVALQAAVFSPLGGDFQGNRNWIFIGGRSLQPSEFAKLALVVFGATVLARKRKVIGRVVHALVPFILPGAMLLIGLVVAGHDLGTAMIMVAIAGGMLFVAGLPLRWFAVVGLLVAGGIGYLAAGSGNRMQRIETWLGDTCTSPHVDGCFQKVHAEYALADGGWWGLGLGASREKWSLLPEPHNDFILAIIGEELGLPGSLTVLLLFAVLGYASFRIVADTPYPFVRLAAAGVMIWMLSQAVLNIGSVIGMLPIVGVPLPLVSSGGSALVAALMGIGLLLAMARSLPGCSEALSGRSSRLRRTLAAFPGAGQGGR